MTSLHDKDRRIARTRHALHEALFSLLQEKDYDQIVVKEVLDRANIGRSTFYTHFRDLDDLLVSGIEQMLGSQSARRRPPQGKEAITAFGLPIFEHVFEHHGGERGNMGPRGRAILHERLRQVLAGRLAREFKEELRSRKATKHVPTEVLVQFVASTFVLVLNWWVDGDMALSPKETHALFCRLVEPALGELAKP